MVAAGIWLIAGALYWQDTKGLGTSGTLPRFYVSAAFTVACWIMALLLAKGWIH